jgi:hypothetical protein
MSADPSPSPRFGRLPWWVAPAAGVALAAGTGAVIWAYRDRPAGPPPDAGRPDAVGNRATVPLPPGNGAAGLHSVVPAVEHGVRVLKIRVTPGGDELIVDAVTGRLLETRPAPRPAGPGGPKPVFNAP